VVVVPRRYSRVMVFLLYLSGGRKNRAGRPTTRPFKKTRLLGIEQSIVATNREELPMETTVEIITPRRVRTAAALPVAIVTTVVAGVLASTVISAIAHGAGVSHAFLPLHFATFTGLIVLAAIAGAIGWQLVRTLATHPSQVLARLVPIVLLLSFIPDVLVGITKAETATTWGGVFALMAMHVFVATAAVASYFYFLPVRSINVQHERS
jgi:hypothetical protein